MTSGGSRREKILRAVAFTAQAVLQGLPWRSTIQQALERFGEATGVSRVYVFRCEDEGRRVSQMFEWASDGVEPQIDNPMLQDVPTAEVGMERWIELLSAGEAIHGPVAELPESERQILEAQEIRSLAVVPIFVEEVFWGFLGFDDCGRSRRWSEAELDGLRAAAGMLGAAVDVTERKAAEERLTHDACHDPLTDLPNRKLFRDRLEMAMACADRHPGERFAVVYVDLDRFKQVNDGLGHPAGDELLVAIARRLAGAVRPGDMVARLGGDEFGVLLLDLADPSQALRCAERLHREFEQPFLADGHVVLASASMGIALHDERYQRPDELLRDADLAMYRAKAIGGGQRLVFDPEMHRLAIERLDLESALRRALERREFELHYQPIVSLGDGRVEGVEALVRWRHPQRGLLEPEAFLGVLEESGLITSLGHWVLDDACRTAEAWRRRWPELTVNVNLQGREFAQGDLVEIVERALASHGLPPRALNLEFTEGVLLDATTEADRVLAELRRLGVGLAIDDFGLGYSSLSYLHRLPIDTVKVDRRFVSRLGEGEGNEDLLRSIAALAQALSLRVVGEGVECDDHLATLRRLGFDAAQGFLFARPLGETRLESVLEEGRRW